MRSDGGRKRTAGRRERGDADQGSRRAIRLCGLALAFPVDLAGVSLVPVTGG